MDERSYRDWWIYRFVTGRRRLLRLRLLAARGFALARAETTVGEFRRFGAIYELVSMSVALAETQLLLLQPEEWRRWPDLHMKLSVNGQVRQDSLCRDMIHPPHKTISEFSALQNLQAGDLIATGTPAGCAAKAPGKLAMWVARHFLSEATKWRFFIKGGLRNPLYLQPNDVMTLSIRTDDGALDLGQQRNRVTTA